MVAFFTCNHPTLRIVRSTSRAGAVHIRHCHHLWFTGTPNSIITNMKCSSMYPLPPFPTVQLLLLLFGKVYRRDLNILCKIKRCTYASAWNTVQLNWPLDTRHGCWLSIVMYVIARLKWALKANYALKEWPSLSKSVVIVVNANVSFQDKWNIFLYVAYALTLFKMCC